MSLFCPYKKKLVMKTRFLPEKIESARASCWRSGNQQFVMFTFRYYFLLVFLVAMFSKGQRAAQTATKQFGTQGGLGRPWQAMAGHGWSKAKIGQQVTPGADGWHEIDTALHSKILPPGHGCYPATAGYGQGRTWPVMAGHGRA